MKKMTRTHAYEIFSLLEKHYPHATMILKWENNFELLVAIILSAQCTDVVVNKVTATLFPTFRSLTLSPTHVSFPRDKRLTPEIQEIVNFAEVPLEELEQDIRSTGFYHHKAKNVQNAARVVLETFQGVLPQTMADMLTIPGVGRKTANVFLGNAYHIYEGIAVDTHVKKQARLLDLTTHTTPDKIEQDLMKLFDKKDWFKLTYLLIEHGRNVRKKRSDRFVCDTPETCLLCHL